MQIKITYRYTSRLSMRIVKNGDVHVSAPVGLPKKTVEDFIQQHLDWIADARKRTLQKQQQRSDFYAQLQLSTRAQKLEATARLSAIVQPMVEHHSLLMGVSPSAVTFKALKSRWGQCNVKNRAICISLYTLLLPEWCIEHVVVHELCHLLEPTHNARFHSLMDHYFPRWRQAHQETRRIQLLKAMKSPLREGR